VIKVSLRRVYRVVPSSLRQSLRGLGAFRRLRKSIFESDTSLHDSYYTDEYYENDVAAPAADAAPVICRDIISLFAPKDVIDVGCGTGAYLKAFRSAGITGYGVELAAAALRRCRENGLSVICEDLSRKHELPWRADVVYSFEVAEHIPESGCENYVRALCHAARKAVVITAAAPGQAGLCHINCQPKEYWIRRFTDQGLAFANELTMQWEARCRRNSCLLGSDGT